LDQAVVLVPGWQVWHGLAGLVAPLAWNVPSMRQPLWQRFVLVPPVVWQTSPGQHWASLLHFDWGFGAAGLQVSSASAPPPARANPSAANTPPPRPLSRVRRVEPVAMPRAI
jgi:hypothetical protein